MRRRKQIVQRAEYCRVAELAGEPTRCLEVHVGDPDQANLGDAPGDEPGVNRAHPPGPDNPDPDPWSHADTQRSSRAVISRDTVLAAIPRRLGYRSHRPPVHQGVGDRPVDGAWPRAAQ